MEEYLARQKTVRASVSLLMAIAFAVHAGDDSGKPPPSRQINQESLSCLHPGNCVNSFSSYGLDALPFDGNGEQAMALLRATLATFPEATIVSSSPLYLEVIFTTTIGFKDQVEFRIDEPSQLIDFRSRSKIGLYDFNKNRSRMQNFSTSFKAVSANARKSGEN
jgi:uncharacterized protein (DUF1499 family)